MAKEEKPLEYERRILDTKGLAQRIDLDYLRRPQRFRDLRRRLVWGAPAVAVLAILPFFFGAGRKVFSSGPVSPPHAIFEGKCALCHAAAFSKVADGSCRTCHDAGAHQTVTAESRCAVCHREHEGNLVLAQVRDVHCTRCHADLGSAARRLPAGASPLRITGFRQGEHPDFRAAGAGDSRPLRLNHQKHLALKKEDAERYKLATARSDGTKDTGAALPMKCSDCHAADRNSSSGDLLPITFDQHCRSCHARELEFDVNGLLPAGAGVAPHLRDPAAIRNAIQEQYRSLAARDPAVTRKPLGRDLVVRGEAAWLAAVVRQSGEFLFSRKCRYCHEYDGAHGELPVVRRVNAVRGRYVPDKTEGVAWLPHARKFSHRVHRPIQCISCHQQARDSVKTADVLIPHAQNCMPCHGNTGTSQDRCAQCHLYHDRSKEVDRDRRPLEELIAERTGRRAWTLKDGL